MTRDWTTGLPALAPEVLESIYQHRLLTTRQVHTIHTPDTSRRWTQHLLAGLAGHGLLDATRGPYSAAIWFATEAGTAAVDRIATRAERRRKIVTPAYAAGQLQAHTLAVNDVGIAYLTVARARGDEFGPLSWRHEIAHRIGAARGRGRRADVLIADALITYLAAHDGGVERHQRFLELDRGTTPVEALLAKLTAYRRLRDAAPATADEKDSSRGWRRWYPAGLPGVQLVLTGKPRAQLERRAQLLVALRDADSRPREGRSLDVRLALLEDLSRRGPFAPIWLCLDDPTRRVDWLGTPERAPS